MVLDSTIDKVLAPCEAKHITVHACACANGMMLPLMIIYMKGFLVVHTHVEDQLMHCIRSLSLAIWMASSIHSGSDRPVVLTQDGRKSHMTVSMVEAARHDTVVLFSSHYTCNPAVRQEHFQAS